jgi:hypothetical protein
MELRYADKYFKVVENQVYTPNPSIEEINK